MQVRGEIAEGLRVEKRFWFRPAFFALCAMCVCASLVSLRLANAISEAGCTILARHCFKYGLTRPTCTVAPLRKKDPAEPSP